MSQSSSISNNWFVCPKINPKAEMRLFLFPYAGGSPAAFWKWFAEFPSTVEIWIGHYPGRGSRHNEAPAKELGVLVEYIQQAIQPLLDKPFAFFGHSLGGLVAYELTRALSRYSLPQPNMIFISACGAPHMPNQHPPIHVLPDSEFMKALLEFNGTPDEVASNPELLEILLPALRADFEAIESYQYNLNSQPLSCPIIAFGGRDDTRVSREHLEGWVSQTSSRFQSIYFPGNHFYLNSLQDEIVQSITAEMMVSYDANRKLG